MANHGGTPGADAEAGVAPRSPHAPALPLTKRWLPDLTSDGIVSGEVEVYLASEADRALSELWVLKAERDALKQEKERWFIECERLATGLLETFEERADEDHDGELKPEQAVDVAFRLLDELLKAEAALHAVTRERDEAREIGNGYKGATDKLYAALTEVRTAITAVADKLDPLPKALESFIAAEDWPEAATALFKIRDVASQLRAAAERTP